MAPFAEHVQDISRFFEKVESGRLRIQDGVKEYRQIEDRIMADWIAGRITASGKGNAVGHPERMEKSKWERRN